MMKKQTLRLFALLCALALLLAACGGTQAASMFLRKAEGTVSVSDAGGADVALAEDLGLFSGYGVGTQAASYAWIDLDRTKLTKMDENSAVAITKEGEKLALDVQAGNLFFNITEPLADSETMEIRAADLLVGIRGTCGWVKNGDGQPSVWLLEGTVQCTAGEQTATVRAGERAVRTETGALEVAPFGAGDVPAFVRAELEADQTLAARAEAAAGFDPTAPAPDAADMPEAGAEDAADPAQDVFYLRDHPGHVQETAYFPSGTVQTSQCVYDENGLRIQRLNSNGYWTQFHYDEQGRLVDYQNLRPDGSVNNAWTVTEDTAQLRVMVMDGNSAVVAYTYYDELGRPTRQEVLEGGVLNNFTTYEFDDLGRVAGYTLTVAEPDGTQRVQLTCTYDYEA